LKFTIDFQLASTWRISGTPAKRLQDMDTDDFYEIQYASTQTSYIYPTLPRGNLETYSSGLIFLPAQLPLRLTAPSLYHWSFAVSYVAPSFPVGYSLPQGFAITTLLPDIRHLFYVHTVTDSDIIQPRIRSCLVPHGMMWMKGNRHGFSRRMSWPTCGYWPDTSNVRWGHIFLLSVPLPSILFPSG
jgi:hypothetical protein